jgi:hypothetical protein
LEVQDGVGDADHQSSRDSQGESLFETVLGGEKVVRMHLNQAGDDPAPVRIDYGCARRQVHQAIRSDRADASATDHDRRACARWTPAAVDNRSRGYNHWILRKPIRNSYAEACIGCG